MWQQHVTGDAVDATLLDHALRFFERENHVRVEELLHRAELAYPGDARWAKRRRAPPHRMNNRVPRTTPDQRLAHQGS